MKVTPYMASIDRSLLKYVVLMGWFDDFDLEVSFVNLTGENM